MTAKPVFRHETFTGSPTSLSFILVFPTDPGIKTLVVDLASESGDPGRRKPDASNSNPRERYLGENNFMKRAR